MQGPDPGEPQDVRLGHVWGVATLLLVLGLGGCTGEEPPSSDAPSAAELEHLRSLGYLDFAPDKADPDRDGTVVHDPERSSPGYNLYTLVHARRTELIDADGTVLKTWQYGDAGRWVRSLLLPSGELLVVGTDLPRRFVLRLSWDNELIWERDLPAHHDIAPTPDGHFMVLTLKERSLPAVDPDAAVRDDFITILDDDGELVREHSLFDMFRARPDIHRISRVESSHGIIDLLHANSLRWLSDPDLARRDSIYATTNVVVCFRNQDTVAIFDLDRKEVVWAWGRGTLRAPHDAAVLDNGHVLVFDNGEERRWSRVLEIDPLTRRIVWEYAAEPPEEFYTLSRGGNQRLPNGNTLITQSGSGRAFEVTPEGEIVWEYLVPYYDDKGHRAVIVRLYRYEPELVEAMGRLDLTGSAPAKTRRLASRKT